MALLHDVPEIRTGDNPTPAKTPEMKSLLDKTEAEIYPPLSDLEERSTRRAKDFHKFCDTAESILFLEVNGLGRHAKDVQGLLTQQMTERLEKSCFSVWEREALMGAYRKTKAYT
jgi:5'-deoxynucleotidase YfbR-like HD superfamily hydrolase